MNVDILVAGRFDDPDTHSVLRAVERLGLTRFRVVPDEATEPALTWEPNFGTLTLDGEEVRPGSVFLRYEHFGPGDYETGRGRNGHGLGWISTLASWAFAAPDVRIFNQGFQQSSGLKGYALHRAARLGLPVPTTFLNSFNPDIVAVGPLSKLRATPAGASTIKPCIEGLAKEDHVLEEISPPPAIVQEMLGYPKVRIFVVGAQIFAFETLKEDVNIRAGRKSRTRVLANDRLPQDLVGGLLELSCELGLDFCAYDLKTRPETGELCFLEVDPAPMFSAFDSLVNGQLADAIVTCLASGLRWRSMAAE